MPVSFYADIGIENRLHRFVCVTLIVTVFLNVEISGISPHDSAIKTVFKNSTAMATSLQSGVLLLWQEGEQNH